MLSDIQLLICPQELAMQNQMCTLNLLLGKGKIRSLLKIMSLASYFFPDHVVEDDNCIGARTRQRKGVRS
jgi:hypothetical protein